MQLKMKLRVALVSSLLVLAATAGAVTFDATNAVPNTPGGAKFDQDVGVDYAKQVLSKASSFVWNTFNQPNPSDRRPFDSVTLTVVGTISKPEIAALTSNNAISLNDQYVANYAGDEKDAVNKEVTGVLYHEVVHVWQWGLQDYAAQSWVFEGIADFVRLKAGYGRADWAQPGQGNSWKDSYSVTARFLDYCNSLKPGFVAELNAKLKDGYSDDYFVQILGKSVEQLWQDYKATK